MALLAGTLALDSADKAMVGAVAVALKQAMGIGNLQLALLIALPTLCTALATLPFGVFTDRINRTNFLAGAIVSWGVLMVIGGAAISYLMLLLSRLALGAVTAAAVPVVASLTGDCCHPHERIVDHRVGLARPWPPRCRSCSALKLSVGRGSTSPLR